METKVIKFKDFKPENIKLSPLRMTKSGRKIVYINYDYEDGNSPKPLRIQMPKMKTPFGIAGWDNDRTDKKDKSPTKNSNDTLELSIGDDKAIVEKFEKIDDIVINQAIDNTKEYFKKKLSPEYVKLQYKSSLKFSQNEDMERDDKYPPRIKTKLYKNKDFVYQVKIFDENKKSVSIDIFNQEEVIPKGSECLSLLECSGIWIVNDSYGLSWVPVQMIVYKTNNNLTGYSFIEESEDEDNSEEIENKEEVKEVKDLSENLDTLSVKVEEDPDLIEVNTAPVEKESLPNKKTRKTK